MTPPPRQDNLQSLANVATVGNYFKLSEIERQTQAMNASIAQQRDYAQFQARIRQDIFLMRQELEQKLPHLKKVVGWMLVDRMVRYLTANNISAMSYDAIADKEYFVQTHAMIEKAVGDLKPFEQEGSQIRKDCEAVYELRNVKEQFLKTRASLDRSMMWEYLGGLLLLIAAIIIGVEGVDRGNLPVLSYLLGLPGVFLLFKAFFVTQQNHNAVPRQIMEFLRGAPLLPTERFTFQQAVDRLDETISASEERSERHKARYPELKDYYQ